MRAVFVDPIRRSFNSFGSPNQVEAITANFKKRRPKFGYAG